MFRKKMLTIGMLASALLSSNALYAQAVKIGFIQNSKISQAPQFKTIEDKLEKEFGDRIKRFEKNKGDYVVLRNKYQAELPTMNQSTMSTRQRELLEKEKGLAAEENALNVDVAQRREEESRVFREKFDKALKKVVDADQLDLVITEANGTVMYRSEKIDITAKVLRELSLIK